jgi:hypothetical protein
MKTTALHPAGGPSARRRNPKRTIGLNHSAVNGAASRRVKPAPPGEKSITCAQAAKILRFADQMLTEQDRAQIAAGIQEARRRMNNEHLR